MANETEKKLILVHHQNPLKFSETMQGLKAQRDNGEFCDVKMNIEGKQIFAHSCVLAANSPHLKTHFLDPSNWSVGLAFPATNVQTTEALIDYMYTSFLGVHLDIMEDLIAAAEQLQMTDIPALCEDYLIQTLSLSNWLSVRRIARQCSLTSAIAHVRSWISCHLSEIISNSDFLELDKSDVILILTDSVDKKQAELLEAVLTWLCHDFQQRKEFYTELLDNVIDMAFLPADCSQKIEENPKFNEIAKNEVTIELLRKLREETSLNNCANDGHESEAVTETEHFSDQETAKNVLPMSRSEKKSRGRPPKQKAKTSEAELHAEPDPKDGVKVKTSAKPKQTSTHSEMQPRVDIAERNWSLSLADINNSNAGKKRECTTTVIYFQNRTTCSLSESVLGQTESNAHNTYQRFPFVSAHFAVFSNRCIRLQGRCGSVRGKTAHTKPCTSDHWRNTRSGTAGSDPRSARSAGTASSTTSTCCVTPNCTRGVAKSTTVPGARMKLSGLTN